jgi:hypothetical protein
VIHRVTVEVKVDQPHHDVQSRVLAAVVREFTDRDPGVMAIGFDLEKHEKALALVTTERDEYRRGWLVEQAKASTLAAQVAALVKKRAPIPISRDPFVEHKNSRPNDIMGRTIPNKPPSGLQCGPGEKK